MAAGFVCPKGSCAGASFEAAALEVNNLEFAHVGIRCELCGALVAVLETQNIGATLEDLNASLEGMSEPVGNTLNELDRIRMTLEQVRLLVEQIDTRERMRR